MTKSIPNRCTCHDEYVGGPHEGCSEFDPGPDPCPVHEGRIVEDGEGGWTLIPSDRAKRDETIRAFAQAQKDGDAVTENQLAHSMGDWDEEDYAAYNSIRHEKQDQRRPGREERDRLWTSREHMTDEDYERHFRPGTEAGEDDPTGGQLGPEDRSPSRFVDHHVVWVLGEQDAEFLLGVMQEVEKANDFDPPTDSDLRWSRLTGALHSTIHPKESE